MEIEEIKTELGDLKSKIFELIKDFERRTEVIVGSIDLYRFSRIEQAPGTGELSFINIECRLN